MNNHNLIYERILLNFIELVRKIKFRIPSSPISHRASIVEMVWIANNSRWKALEIFEYTKHEILPNIMLQIMKIDEKGI